MLAALIAHWTGADDRQAIAESVAKNSSEAVWNRVRRRISELSVNEARGYIRTRALPILRARIEMATDSLSATAAVQARLLEMTTDIIVRAMLQRVAHSNSRPDWYQRAA